MKFYSTNGKSPMVGLEEAVMNGLAPDGGLYMPFSIPNFSDDFFKRIGLLSFPDIAFHLNLLAMLQKHL